MSDNYHKITRVYKYGVLFVHKDSRKLLDDSYFAQCRHYNRLLEVERVKQDRIDEINYSFIPELRDIKAELLQIDEQLESIRTAIGRAKGKARSSKAVPLDMLKQWDGLKCRQKELWETQKVHFATLKANPERKKLLEASYEDFKAMDREAYAQAPELIFGTRNATKESVTKAVEKTRKVSGPDSFPKRKRYDHSGTLTHQIQGGATWDDVLNGKCCGFTVEQHGKCLTGHLKIASVKPPGKRWEPVTVSFRFKMHRPLPPGASIRQIMLVRRKITYYRHAHPERPEGIWLPKYDYSVQFQITYPLAKHEGQGSVAVDLGWRKHPLGVRVATWVGSDGKQGTLVIPQQLIERKAYVKQIQSNQDLTFDICKEKMLEFLTKLPAIPEWLDAETKTLHAWKSHGKMARLHSIWKRFDGDAEMWQFLCEWVERHGHFHTWHRHQLTRFELQRQAIFRQFAATLRKYQTVIVPDTDYSKIREQKDSEYTATLREVASVGMLRDAIANAVPVKRVSVAGLAERCPVCGDVADADPLGGSVSCSCGHRDDYDVVQARAMLTQPIAETQKAEKPKRVRKKPKPVPVNCE